MPISRHTAVAVCSGVLNGNAGDRCSREHRSGDGLSSLVGVSVAGDFGGRLATPGVVDGPRLCSASSTLVTGSVSTNTRSGRQEHARLSRLSEEAHGELPVALEPWVSRPKLVPFVVLPQGLPRIVSF